MNPDPTRRARRIVLAIATTALLALAAGACGDDGAPADGAAGAKIVVSDAWARTSASLQTTGAVYLSITGGDGADRLVGALAPVTIANTTEIHETVAAEASTPSIPMGSEMSGTSTTAAGGGMMSMRPVSGIDIPAKDHVDLKPGGYHIMLFDLVSPLALGQTFTLTLTFEKAGIIEVPVEVRAP
jgi:copper(I)-binding protein